MAFTDFTDLADLNAPPPQHIHKQVWPCRPNTTSKHSTASPVTDSTGRLTEQRAAAAAHTPKRTADVWFRLDLGRPQDAGRPTDWLLEHHGTLTTRTDNPQHQSLHRTDTAHAPKHTTHMQTHFTLSTILQETTTTTQHNKPFLPCNTHTTKGIRKIGATAEEPQRIVTARSLCHLQYRGETTGGRPGIYPNEQVKWRSVGAEGRRNRKPPTHPQGMLFN